MHPSRITPGTEEMFAFKLGTRKAMYLIEGRRRLYQTYARRLASHTLNASLPIKLLPDWVDNSGEW